jgi:hypothetical protein
MTRKKQVFYWVFGYISIPLYYTKIIRSFSKLGLLDIENARAGDYTGGG